MPKGWAVCTLGDIGDSQLGKTLDREKDTGDIKPYLCALNVLWDKFDLSQIKTFKIECFEQEKYRINNGDLLICEGGECGRCAVWTKTTEMYYQNALHRVRFKDNINPHFFQLLFSWLYEVGLIQSYSKGMTIKHFSKTALMSVPLALPPNKEQQRIVDAVLKYNSILSSIEKLLN